MIEHKIGEIVFIVNYDTLLPRLEAEALAKFQQKLLQVSEQRAFQVILRIHFLSFKSKEFKREWLSYVHQRITMLAFDTIQKLLRITTYSTSEEQVC